jgi:hypothetical protein
MWLMAASPSCGILATSTSVWMSSGNLKVRDLAANDRMMSVPSIGDAFHA